MELVEKVVRLKLSTDMNLLVNGTYTIEALLTGFEVVSSLTKEE